MNAAIQTPVATDSPLLQRVCHISHAVQENGGRALLVGGFVRDELLGLQPKDADIEVFGMEAETLRQLLKLFGRINCVGESFQVYKLAWHQRGQRYELDISIPRHERKIGAGHRGFITQGDPNASVEDAARRRDFTINAILRDPLTGEILDPFHGRQDLEVRLLRMVDAAHFGEDSLRVLRAAQFAARFEMTIETETCELCRTLDLGDLPKERVWGEWEKLLMKSAWPSLGVRALFATGALPQLHPYLVTALMRQRQKMCDALDGAARERQSLDYTRGVTLMLACLGSFLGHWRAQNGHGIVRLLDDLNIFTLNNYDVRKNAILLCGERKRAADWFRARDQITDRDFRFLAARVNPRLIYHLARARGEIEAAQWFRERMESLDVFDGPPAPLLMGRHLLEMGLKPGPAIGRITNAVWIAQLSGDVTNLEEALESARREIESAS